MTTGNGTRKINAAALAADVKSGLDDQSLMKKHQLTQLQLDKLLDRLVEKGVITAEVVQSRKKASDSDLDLTVDFPAYKTEQRVQPKPRGYVQQHLMPGEVVVHITSLHWIVLTKGLAWLLVGLCLVAMALPFLSQTGGGELVIMGIICIVIATIQTITAWINYSTSEFAVTNKRVIIKVGLIRRKSLDMLLIKVESIAASESVLGRLWGYGTLVVTGTGGSKDVFHNINAALQFRASVQNQIAKL